MADTAVLEQHLITAAPYVVQVAPMPVPNIAARAPLPWTNGELHVQNQPRWLRLFRTAAPALEAVRWNRATVGLFHFESNCLAQGLPPVAGETDAAKFARWCLGADLGIKRAPISQSPLPTIAAKLGTHDDDPREVAEILRIGSATAVPDPAKSGQYFFARHLFEPAVLNGDLAIYSGARGWGMYLYTRFLHAGPAYALQNGTPLEGPFLPEEGEFAMGRNRVFLRPGAQFLTDDMWVS